MITCKDVKRARERLGESQAEFAKRFEVNQSAVSRWETVRISSKGPTLALIKRVLAELEAA